MKKTKDTHAKDNRGWGGDAFNSVVRLHGSNLYSERM